MEKTRQAPVTGNMPKEAAKYMAIAKGQEKPGFDDETISRIVQFGSEDTAALELERREYNPLNGKKTSKPRIVTFNRQDLMSFLLETKEEVGGEVVKICEGRLIHGLVNVVYHVPAKWNIKVEPDAWSE